MQKTLIFIPTYNEAENVLPLYSQIKKLPLKCDILFVDDNSTDGTGQIIRKISRKDTSVKLIRRAGKLGIGSAHITGIHYAYKKGYKILITMDADFTHQPADILKFVKKMNSADVVIGSRYLAGNSLTGWNPIRRTLTTIAHIMTKKLLKMPYDATGAFRLYKLDKIPEGLFDLVESKSYSFFFESLFVLFLNGLKINEVAINLPPRTYGSSKMQAQDVFRSLRLLAKTYFLSKIYRESFLYSRSLSKKKLNVKGEDEWDNYWQKGRKNRKILYDAIATFYRKFIIKKNLNRIIRKTFGRGDRLLHAGCGSGQVDEDIVNYAKITGLDFSAEAINRYKTLYKNRVETIHGSIFDIPRGQYFEGVYNLGVMEHLTQIEIKKALSEFYKVLEDGGKIVLFWPPAFGLSVLFLNSTHFILNNVLGKNIRLHPHEISKIKSRAQIEKLLNGANFKLKGYYFGPSDLFTYVVVVGEKNHILA